MDTNKDIYRVRAAKTLGIPYEEVSNSIRSAQKSVCFGCLGCYVPGKVPDCDNCPARSLLMYFIDHKA